jgi:hypothetical protein
VQTAHGNFRLIAAEPSKSPAANPKKIGPFRVVPAGELARLKRSGKRRSQLRFRNLARIDL